MKELGYYNGKIGELNEMTVPMNDRACWFGDGVYEAAMVRNYHFFALNEHIDRLFRSAAKLEITVPTASAEMQASRYRREVIINIDKEGDIFINSIKISDERLDGILKALRADNANQPVVIRADQDARHKDVIKVLDLCTRHDIRNVAFSTIKPTPTE